MVLILKSQSFTVKNLINKGLYCFVKNLKSKNSVEQKSNKREKKYSALNVHIASFEMNNLILVTCYIDTYANQSLYTNLVNNFARFRVSVYVSLT